MIYNNHLLYRFPIVKFNLYILKYPMLLGIFDMYKLTVLLEYLYKFPIADLNLFIYSF
jgi:hypothetical protein